MLADRTTGIRASVHDVEMELLLAVVLVVLVIFFFLHSIRATIIAGLAVPISLIGTCGVTYLLGFSLNNLSLMALTIATGFVVDDAIVMLENISRHVEDGEPPFEAALNGAKQIGFTIISLTVSLLAVLIPLLFMGDVVGRLFREFAITLAITILISAVVSLTLTPMMAARWMTRRRAPRQAGQLRREDPGLVRQGGRPLRPRPDLGAGPAEGDPDRRHRHLPAHRPALHGDPQGPVPGAGHRPAAGAHPGAGDRLLRQDGRAAATRWPTRS